MQPKDASNVTIYNYKTGEFHTEKSLMIVRKDKLIITSLGNECETFVHQLPNPDDFEYFAPIANGRVEHYEMARNFIKWMLWKTVNDKKRIIRRSIRVLLFLHKPCLEVDKKTYNDILYSLNYREILMITPETDLAGRSPHEAIRRAEEVHGKIDCAIEIE